MRTLLRFVLLFAVVVAISPFIVSSMLIDQRGVMISGHVVSKDERIVVHYASWTRKLDFAVEYDPPDESSVAFSHINATPAQFDSLKKGDVVQLRYLREKDLPAFPGARTLRQMHVLPTARWADHHAWSGLEEGFDSHRVVVITVLIVGFVLILWRLLRIPFFAWAVGTCVVFAIGASVVDDFPRPTPAPKDSLRTTAGVIKSVERVEWLFQDSHERGINADQPIQIAGVQFVPEGRVEPVVAVDLIDDGSVPGLREHSAVVVEYESATPRVAYIRGATRHFVRRNLQGMVIQGVATLVVVGALLAAGWLLRSYFRRLIRRRST